MEQIAHRLNMVRPEIIHDHDIAWAESGDQNILFVSWKDIKQATADLKRIYTSVTLEEAEENLRQFAEKWRKQYPSCVKSWEDHRHARCQNWDLVLSQLEILFAGRTVG